MSERSCVPLSYYKSKYGMVNMYAQRLWWVIYTQNDEFVNATEEKCKARLMGESYVKCFKANGITYVTILKRFVKPQSRIQVILEWLICEYSVKWGTNEFRIWKPTKGETSSHLIRDEKGARERLLWEYDPKSGFKVCIYILLCSFIYFLLKFIDEEGKNGRRLIYYTKCS
jgi:hypothetical protein